MGSVKNLSGVGRGFARFSVLAICGFLPVFVAKLDNPAPTENTPKSTEIHQNKAKTNVFPVVLSSRRTPDEAGTKALN